MFCMLSAWTSFWTDSSVDSYLKHLDDAHVTCVTVMQQLCKTRLSDDVFLNHMTQTVYIHTCLLLILMLWHRQAIFESTGDKLAPSAECRIRTLVVWETKSPADWMPIHKSTGLSRIKHKLELDSPFIWWASIQPTWLHCRSAFAPGSGDIHDCC